MGGGWDFGGIDGAGIPLCVSFPSLFALSIDKEAWVADIWDPLAEGG